MHCSLEQQLLQPCPAAPARLSRNVALGLSGGGVVEREVVRKMWVVGKNHDYIRSTAADS